MGDEDYDDYSKELNQYRRSKDSRGRGGQGPQKLVGLLLAAVSVGFWGRAVADAISLLRRVKSRPWPGFPRPRQRDGPGPRSRWQPRRDEQGWNER